MATNDHANFGPRADQTSGTSAGHGSFTGEMGNGTTTGGGCNYSPPGDTGNGRITGGAGNDTIIGESENDTIIGIGGANLVQCGIGDDLFIYGAGMGEDTITGFGTSPDGETSNNDFIDLTSYYTNLTELRDDLSDDGLLNQSVGDYSDSTAMDGSLRLSGVSRSDLTNEATGLVCFARGTQIHTLRGRIPVEHVHPGDLIQTRDDGVQPVRWVGNQRVAAWGQFTPIRIAADAMGNDRDLWVSPQHRMLLRGWRPKLFTGEPEALAAAKLLLGMPGVREMQGGSVEYFHILFDRHQLILAESCWSESFQPDATALNALEDGMRNQLFDLFPSLRNIGPSSYCEDVRRSLQAHEAALCHLAA